MPLHSSPSPSSHSRWPLDRAQLPYLYLHIYMLRTFVAIYDKICDTVTTKNKRKFSLYTCTCTPCTVCNSYVLYVRRMMEIPGKQKSGDRDKFFNITLVRTFYICIYFLSASVGSYAIFARSWVITLEGTRWNRVRNYDTKTAGIITWQIFWSLLYSSLRRYKRFF